MFSGIQNSLMKEQKSNLSYLVCDYSEILLIGQKSNNEVLGNSAAGAGNSNSNPSSTPQTQTIAIQTQTQSILTQNFKLSSIQH